MIGFKMLKEQEHVWEPLSPSQVQQLIDAMPTYQMKAFVALLSETGLRKSECITLTWSQISHDPKRGSILSTDLTKNYRSHQIPLSEEAVRWLRGIPRHVGTPLVFVRARSHQSGKARTIDPTATFFRCAAKAALQGVGFHDLRRYRATQWHRDLEVREISYLLGHSSIETTRRYLGIDKGLTERARAVQSREQIVRSGRQVADTGVETALEEGGGNAVNA